MNNFTILELLHSIFKRDCISPTASTCEDQDDKDEEIQERGFYSKTTRLQSYLIPGL